MKRTYRNLFSLLLAPVLFLSLNATAFAADSVITYKSVQEGFAFQPGSEYTATDLFDSFKDVMPGDELTEVITIVNEATDCDYIEVYMRAQVHDQQGNLLIQGETLVSMADFLAQLTMRIYNGSELIYEATPDQAGQLADNVLLGTLRNGEELMLKVELDVPITLGNEYANRAGEVDWVFLAEAYDDPPEEPDKKEEIVPSTGDDSNIYVCLVMAILGCVILSVLAKMKKNE